MTARSAWSAATKTGAPSGAVGASAVAGSAQRLRANEQRAAGGRGIDTAALRRSLQRASALAARALQHSAHYAGVSRTLALKSSATALRARAGAHNAPCVM